jgi:NADPH:quinone reductase-like Zn-dependent oxidoreductase
MKAIVYTKSDPSNVLQLMDVPKPEPKENQVLIKIHAASINALDYRSFGSAGKVLGADIAGLVEAVGSNVKQFQSGDEVFGVSAGSVGGFAEYASAFENHLALKPANLSFESAAAVPVAAITALQGLRDKIQPGQKVLINGAGGGVGTFAVQIAKAFGAEVTAVCSARNAKMACSIGADHVIDYAKEDFTQNGKQYDMIFAVNGFHPLSAYRRALTPQGRYVCAGGTIPQILQAMLLGPFMSRKNGKKMGFMGIAKPNQKDLVYLKELLEAGKIVPVIEKRYPLSEVPSAIRYLLEGHARGKVVVQVC